MEKERVNSMAKLDTPTMVEVAELTDRAASLEQQAEQLAAEEQDLTKRIAEHHASGGTGVEFAALTKQRRAVREERADILETLPLLRDQVAKDRELACTAEAATRMRGISRAFGSLRQELEEDVTKVQAQAAVYVEAVQSVNNRYKSLITLKAEASALSDRLGVPAPAFSPVVLPSLREGCREAAVVVDGARFVDHHHIAPATETCQYKLRTRRTYREINGTLGGKILKAAGPRPWAALTPQQEAIVESRERERQAEAATVARFGGEALRGLTRSRL